MSKRWRSDDRGQAFALEGIIAAVIVASALILGLQAVDIRPLSSGEERTNDNLRTQAQDALAVAAETGNATDPISDPGALREAATCIDDPTGDGEVSPNVDDPDGGTTLSEILESTVNDQFQYWIVIEYQNGSNGVETTQLTDNSPPSNEPTVTVSRQIPLYDSDKIRLGNDGCEVIGEPMLDSRLGLPFYVEDQHPDSELYAVVQIRVVLWS